MKKYIIGFMLGIILTTTIGVMAINITSNTISFVPNDETWEVNTVEGALNDLYNNSLTCGNNIEFKYGSFQQMGNYSAATKQYSFTTETAGKIVVVMQATGSNSGVTGRTTRYVKINGESVELTNVIADVWQFGTYYVGDVPANATVESYISNAASGSLNTAGLFVFFIHE